MTKKLPIEIVLKDNKLNLKKSPKTLDFSLYLLYNRKACKEMRWSRMWLHTYSEWAMEGTSMEYVMAKTKAVSINFIALIPRLSCKLGILCWI